MAFDYISLPRDVPWLSSAIALFFWLTYLRLRLPHRPSQAPREKYPRDKKQTASNENRTLYSPQKPFILPGRISHIRLFPKVHAFSYPYLMVAVPVRSCQSNWLLSINSTNRSWWNRGWLRVEPQDHLDRGAEENLSEKLDHFLQSEGHDPTNYPSVCLVTSPRFLGYKFSPASFWYLYSADLKLTAMIAEVNNTFDERRMYLLPDMRPNDTVNTNQAKTPKFHHTWQKDFHVSPFSSRKGSYALSAADLFRSDGSHGADAVDVTATLISSKGRPKLVARLWSAAEPLDPAAVSIFRALTFLVSWSLVGWMTYPHIVFEAIMLAKRRHLDIWYRPEPRFETIPRHSTAAERYIGFTFRKYLERIVLISPDAFHLRLIDPTAPNPNIATGLSTPTANQSSPTVHMKILTPKFYTFAMSHHSLQSLLSTALLDPAAENRTAHADDAMTLIKLLTDAASLERQEDISKCAIWTFLGLFWGFLTLVRAWLPFTGGVYPNPGLPAARARSTDEQKHNKVRFYEDQSNSYFLDEFMRECHGPLDQIRYVVSAVAVATRQRVLQTVGGA